jgi:hypothetical protein
MKRKSKSNEVSSLEFTARHEVKDVYETKLAQLIGQSLELKSKFLEVPYPETILEGYHGAYCFLEGLLHWV